MVRLAAPIAFTTLIQEAMGFIDIIMLGRYDATQFAASGLGTAIWLFGLLAITGSLMGTSALIAHRVGADEPQEVRNLYLQSLWLGLILGILVMFVLPGAALLLPLAGIQPELIPHVSDYIRITAYSMPALALISLSSSILNGIPSCVSPKPKIAIFNIFFLMQYYKSISILDLLVVCKVKIKEYRCLNLKGQMIKFASAFKKAIFV